MKTRLPIGTFISVVLMASSCGHDQTTPYQGSFGDPQIETGVNSDSFNCPAPIESAPPAAVPQTSALPQIHDSVPLPWYCGPLTRRWKPCQPKDISPLPTPSVIAPPSKLCITPTPYCNVDENEHSLTPDRIEVRDGDAKFGIGGGCIEKPIREVWAILLNHSYMKPRDVDEYFPAERNDILGIHDGIPIFFAFDIRSKVHKFPFNPEWLVNWTYGVKIGSYEEPKEVTVRYFKTDGTSFITTMDGGYALDRTSPHVTSFVMKQTIEAKQYDTDKMRDDIAWTLDQLRRGTPRASDLPDHPPHSSASSQPLY